MPCDAVRCRAMPCDAVPRARLREVAAAHVRAHRVAVEGDVVRVEDRQRRAALGRAEAAGGEAAVQQLGEVADGGPVVHDARLRQPEPDVPQLRQLRRQLEEGGAAGGHAERAAAGDRVARGDHATVVQHRVHLERRRLLRREDAGHVLTEGRAARLREHHVAAELLQRRYEHGTQEASSADTHGGRPRERRAIERLKGDGRAGGGLCGVATALHRARLMDETGR